MSQKPPVFDEGVGIVSSETKSMGGKGVRAYLLFHVWEGVWLHDLITSGLGLHAQHFSTVSSSRDPRWVLLLGRI